MRRLTGRSELDQTAQFYLRGRLGEVLHALRLRGPLASDPIARILHAYLLGVALWLGFWTMVLLPAYPNPPARLLGAALQLVLPLAALVLLRFGFLQNASLFYLVGLWIFATYLIAFNDGIRSPLLANYAIVPIMASWLLGFRGAVWSIVACSSTTLAFALLEMAGIDLPRPFTTPLGIWVTLMQVGLSGAIPVAQILKMRNKALERVQRDAIALRQRENALRESEERFRNMANTAPVMIAVSDANRQAIFFNKTWLDFTGHTMEHELGLGWTAGLHPDERDECLAKISASYDAQATCEIEYRLRRADGQYRSVLCRGVPRFEPDGSFAGYVASVIDVTDLKQALAAQRLESLGVLASGIAHDFNNFLGGILSSSELLLLDVDDASTVRRELEKIKLTAMRASEIVQQLMVYAGEESAGFEEIDLAEVVREMLQLMMVSITKNGALQIDVPGNGPWIRANKAQIRQVVMNLITNASDALGDKEGTISVSLKHVRTQPEKIPLDVQKVPGEDFLRLEVRDSGCGIPEEIQTRIFDPFFSTKRAGRGMGLAAVRGIILSHGGTISVHSAAGSGSSFEILLPCFGQIEQESRAPVIPIPVHASERASATVLIIDDEEMLRRPIATMLRRKVYSVLDAADGPTAKRVFKAHDAIDVVLLDLTLPGMSGREILKELRTIRPGINVVLTTAYGPERALTDAGEQPVYYLRKPYGIKELTSLLRTVSGDEPKPMRAVRAQSGS